MYTFPNDLYSDIRIEDVFETKIELTDGRLDEIKEKEYKGAFIRVFDGKRWFYSATSDIEGIQGELDALAELATVNEKIEENPVVKKFEVNSGDFCEFVGERDIANTSMEDKKKLIESYTALLKGDETISSLKSYYVDNRKKKT